MAGGLNTYGYASQNPIGLTDPFGLHDTTSEQNYPVIPATTIGTLIKINSIMQNAVMNVVSDEGSNEEQDETKKLPSCPPKARQKGDRGKSTDDALEQLKEIEEAQRRYRQGKNNQII